MICYFGITLLEGIAVAAGYSSTGGSRHHRVANFKQSGSFLKIQLSWFPKITNGFYFRAEAFSNFASYIDELMREDPRLLRAYGGKYLHAQSHGESFLAFFENRLTIPGLYILDEPEAALSPRSQIRFLQILNQWENTRQAQFIIATHSAILLTYPRATIFSPSNGNLEQTTYDQTEHYKLTKSVLAHPRRYLPFCDL